MARRGRKQKKQMPAIAARECLGSFHVCMGVGSGLQGLCWCWGSDCGSTAMDRRLGHLVPAAAGFLQPPASCRQPCAQPQVLPAPTLMSSKRRLKRRTPTSAI